MSYRIRNADGEYFSGVSEIKIGGMDFRKPRFTKWVPYAKTFFTKRGAEDRIQDLRERYGCTDAMAVEAVEGKE